MLGKGEKQIGSTAHAHGLSLLRQRFQWWCALCPQERCLGCYKGRQGGWCCRVRGQMGRGWKRSTGPGSHFSIHSLPLTLVLHMRIWYGDLGWGATGSLENLHLFIFNIMCFQEGGSSEGLNRNSTPVTFAALLPGDSVVVLQKPNRDISNHFFETSTKITMYMCVRVCVYGGSSISILQERFRFYLAANIYLSICTLWDYFVIFTPVL